MSDRTVQFNENEHCDNCGAQGAYDFMGDLLCQACADAAIDAEDEWDENC